MTPGSTAPLVSVTLPLIDPVCWANAGGTKNTQQKKQERDHAPQGHQSGHSTSSDVRDSELYGREDAVRPTRMLRRGVGVHRGAEETGFGIEDHRDRDRGDEIGERLLRSEGVDEAPPSSAGRIFGAMPPPT